MKRLSRQEASEKLKKRNEFVDGSGKRDLLGWTMIGRRIAAL